MDSGELEQTHKIPRQPRVLGLAYLAQTLGNITAN